jgi:hypothetical protein
MVHEFRTFNSSCFITLDVFIYFFNLLLLVYSFIISKLNRGGIIFI